MPESGYWRSITVKYMQISYEISFKYAQFLKLFY